ncbi:hypothetical protein TKK_0019570, partial [Trichogramma kaykai]
MASVNSSNPYDINGSNFNPELYIQRLLKECSLKQIMDHEADTVLDTQTLHSDMQTLVYENYNKFIAATDTVRKMKYDFNQMEESMEKLEKNMENITNLSEKITETLLPDRQKVIKLSSTHSLLKKLQFIFKLPENLKERISEENYSKAVQDYLNAQQVLNQYGDMPSFQGIHKDCEEIVEELKTKLRTEFHKSEASTKSLTESVDLLLQLKEPADLLCEDFLSHADVRLANQLDYLKDMHENDVIEFVDFGSNGFLSDLCLVVASYKDMFMNRTPQDVHEFSDDFDTKAISRLNTFVMNNMKKYFELVAKRVDNVADTAVLVRALDRFYKRLQAMNVLCE